MTKKEGAMKRKIYIIMIILVIGLFSGMSRVMANGILIVDPSQVTAMGQGLEILLPSVTPWNSLINYINTILPKPDVPHVPAFSPSVEPPVTIPQPPQAPALTPLVPVTPEPSFTLPSNVAALSIKYHRANVVIENNIATISIDQVFQNSYNRDMEGIYMFPIPENSAITDFAIYIDGKRTSGKVLGKAQARQIYEQIVSKMRDPGLLEYAGQNMFCARVYPIPKHGEKRIELVYQQVLAYDSGLYRFTYPLGTQRFSPTPLEELTLAVKINSKEPLKSVYSPSHAADIRTINPHQASCGYETKNVRPDKDFVLYYSVSEKDMGLNVLCHRKEGEDGYFMLLLSPGQLEAPALKKDIIFVVDTSGSMEGEKLEQTKSALHYCLNNLSPGDRFNVVDFATIACSYRPALVPADRSNVQNGLAYVDGLLARGGTNINEALLSALAMFYDSTQPRMVVFLTDGQPTVGETEINRILNNLRDANKAGVRIFTFGAGSDVNTHLLDELCRVNKGTGDYITEGENIETKVSSFYHKVSQPLLCDIAIDWGLARINEIYPVTLPDIFKGTQLVLTGRYQGNGHGAIKLTGMVNGRKKEFVYEAVFPEVSEANDFIPRLWATRKIGYLVNEIRLHGENSELTDEIVKLSTKHGIMTPYTSFLVLEKESDYHRWGFDIESAGVMHRGGAEEKIAMTNSVGAESAEASRKIVEVETLGISRAPALDSIKYIGGHTFYQRDGVWVDSQYKEGMETTKLGYMSEEYFALLADKPELGKYFAIGERAAIVIGGACYEIQ